MVFARPGCGGMCSYLRTVDAGSSTIDHAEFGRLRPWKVQPSNFNLSAPPRCNQPSSNVGRLDKALNAAPAAGWTVLSMKHDWRQVFPRP